MTDLEEGDELPFDDLPDNEMNDNGKWDLVDDLTLGGEVSGKLITFEFSKVEVTDVTPVEEVMDRE